MKVYVGCSLAHASEALKLLVPEFKQRLAGEGHEVLDFLGEVAGTEAEVYQWDLSQVRAAEKMIAFVDEPSIGLGMELNEAIKMNKPILCFKTDGVYLSRMLRGARDLHLLTITTVASLDETVEHAIAFLKHT